MKFAKKFSKFKLSFSYTFLLVFIFYQSSSSISCMNMRNIEDDVIVKFSSKPEYLIKDQMDLLRNKVRNRMKALENKASGVNKVNMTDHMNSGKLIYD
jgi:hypothetical protein